MKKGHLIVALVGAAIFAWVITHIGLPAILQQLAGVRTALPIVLLMSLCRLLLQTSAWSQALRDQGVSVPPGTLMGVRLASQSMGYLTVLGPVLSEPLKIRLLRAPAEPAMTATFLDDGVYWFTATLMGIAGWLCLPLVAVHGSWFSCSARNRRCSRLCEDSEIAHRTGWFVPPFLRNRFAIIDWNAQLLLTGCSGQMLRASCWWPRR